MHARDDQSKRLPVDPNKLEADKTVGRGSFGMVYSLKADGQGTPLVLKTALGDAGKKDLQTEIDAYALVGENDHIAKCYGVVKVGNEEGMVMESLEGGNVDKAFGDLNRLRETGEITHSEYWGSMQRLFKGTLAGLAHMEKMGFAHNDIKGDNVMIDSRTMEAKLIDIGMTSRVGEDSRGGHEQFQAPEKLVSSPDARIATDSVQDSYSVGQMLHKETEAKDGKDGTFAFGKDITGMGRIPAMIQLAQDAKAYIKKDDQGNTNARVLQPTKPGEDAAKTGKFAEGYESAYVDFLEQMMHPDPSKRLSPSQALDHPFMKDSILNEDESKAALDKMMDSRKGYPTAKTLEKDAADLDKAKEGDNWSSVATKANNLAASAVKTAEGAANAAEAAKAKAESLQGVEAAQATAEAVRLSEEAANARAIVEKALAAAEQAHEQSDALEVKTRLDQVKEKRTKVSEAVNKAATAAQTAVAGQPAREADLRNRVTAQLKRYDTVKTTIKKAVKAEDDILKNIEKAEEAIDKAKPGAEALKKNSLDQLNQYLKDLNTTDQYFSEERERVLALTQELDALVGFIKDDPARKKSVAKDQKNVLKLGKTTRLLISAQAQTQQTLGALKDLLADVEASGNKGVADTDATTGDPAKIRKAAEKLAKHLPKWETKLDADQTFCNQVTVVTEAFQKAVAKAESGGPAITGNQIAALEKQLSEIDSRFEALKILVVGQEEKIAEFDEVASGGTRKEKGRGKGKSGAALAKADQATMIALGAIGTKIKRVRNSFRTCQITLNDLIDQGSEDTSEA